MAALPVISIHHNHVAHRPATVTYPDFCASQTGSVSVYDVRYPWFLTNAVVASCVELVAEGAVGAVGVPVSAGDARRA